MDAIVKEVALELQARLGLGVSTGYDDEALATIEAEVRALVKSGQMTDDIDTVTRLEKAIRDRLNGHEKRSVSVAQRGSVLDNEWDLLAKYASYLEEQEENLRREKAKQRKQQAKAEIEAQLAALAELKQAEQAAKRAEMNRINDDVKRWRAGQIAAREARRCAAERLRADRESQLQDMMRRRHLAALLRRAAEAHAANEAAVHAAKALEIERATRMAARKELEEVFDNNRAAERARREAKRAEQELDLRYMAQYAEMLDRQEAQRKAQLERVRAVQARQAADAATRPPFKRWVDAELIERQAAESAAQAALKEAKRVAAAAESTKKCMAEVATQLKEKKAAKVARIKAMAGELAVAAALSEEVRKERQASAVAAKASRRKLKEELDAQVKQRVTCRPRAGMTPAERKINVRLVREASTALKAKRSVHVR